MYYFNLLFYAAMYTILWMPYIMLIKYFRSAAYTSGATYLLKLNFFKNILNFLDEAYTWVPLIYGILG